MNISKEFAQQLVNYLVTKPYAEVYQMIAELGTIAQESLEVGEEAIKKEK